MSGVHAHPPYRPHRPISRRNNYYFRADRLPPFHMWIKSPTDFSVAIRNRYLMGSVSRYEDFISWFAKRHGVVATKIKSRIGMHGAALLPGEKPLEATYIRKPGPQDTGHQQMIEQALRSVVMVSGWGIKGQGWSGSGIIADPNELFPGEHFPPGTYAIVTNNHVVPAGETKYIAVTLADQRVIKNVKVLKSKVGKAGVQDSTVDCAIMIIRANEGLPVIHIAKNKPREGDTVFAFGHPLGLPKASVTRGIVSRSDAETGAPIFVIQHDAEINPGNSGGPLLNERGELLGLNTFSFRGSNGLSFAMPIGKQLKVLRSIYERGEYVRGDFGFTVESFSQFERVTTGFPAGVPGAKVNWVYSGSSAEKAGLKVGDIVTRIVSIDNKELDVNIDNPFEVTRFLEYMHRQRPGTPVYLQVLRARKDGEKTVYLPMTLSIQTEKLPPFRTTLRDETWGITISKDRVGRAIITEVHAGSPAARENIEPHRWVLEGIEAKEISKDPIRIADLENLKNIFIMLRESETPELTLYLSDVNNAKRQKRITLKRQDVVNFLSQNRFGYGLRSYLAAQMSVGGP